MYLAPRPATPINLVDVIRTIGNCSNVYSAAQRKLTGGGAHVVLRPWKLATRPHSRARRRLQAAARQRLDSDHSAVCVSTRAGACSLSGSSESWPRSALYTFPAGRNFSGYYPQPRVLRGPTSVTGSTSCASSPCGPASRGCASSGAMACSYVRVDTTPAATLALTANVGQACLLKHS